MFKISQGIGLLVIIIACAVALPAEGQTSDALESAFYLEHSHLEEESESYARAREEDRQALQRLVELVEQMDRALFDEYVPVSELRALEGELTMAREAALAALQATSSYRTSIYDNLDRLSRLGEELEQVENRSLVQTEGVGGVWEIDARSAFAGTYGLMKLDLNGTMISGTYRLSNGHQGSVHGSLVGDSVKLTRTDSRRGDDLWIEGTFDRDRGEIVGTWKSKILGTGRPEHGEWTATRISLDEARAMAEELADQ